VLVSQKAGTSVLVSQKAGTSVLVSQKAAKIAKGAKIAKRSERRGRRHTPQSHAEFVGSRLQSWSALFTPQATECSPDSYSCNTRDAVPRRTDPDRVQPV